MGAGAVELIWILTLAGACREAVEWSRGFGVKRDTWEEAPGAWRGWLFDSLPGSGYGYGSGSGYGSGDGGLPGAPRGP